MFVLRSLSLAPRCEARTLVSGNKPGGSERDFPGETRKIQHSTFFLFFSFPSSSPPFLLPVNYPLSKQVASFHQCLLLIKSVAVAVIYESGITVDWCTRVAYNWVTLNR